MRYYFFLLLFFLSACQSGSHPVGDFVSLPADGPVLLVGEPEENLLKKLRSALTKESLTAGYRMLEEDSLFNYRNLVLLRPAADSLTAHHRTAIERFVLAGGRLLIVDDQPTVPYQWAWYAEMRKQGAEPFSHGAGQVLALEEKAPTAEAFFASTTDITPAAAPNLPPPAPKADRFQLEVLDNDIYEPMEMEVLPNGSVLFLERRGKMKLYEKGKTKIVHDFDVCIEGNYEDGLHGIALAPGYGKDNHHLYLYYTPAPCDSTDQILSRFDFKNGVIDTASEVVVLRVAVQRETCCHSGGSVEFGPDGLLYLSTGDNTSSKESDGYSPLDERPGRGPFDAQKSSGNTNDLRGKILRINPTPEGGYEIPEGNLFADGVGGRPEIYVMGARNPFRIAIDPWTNYLYWGDVGPDVGEAGRYGPQSYDEWNQATTAGNYGWPYFVGDNYAYPKRDFATDEVGELYDPERPVNTSPNNTGARELPPAQPAFIWYPYGPSEEFPVLGKGSRSAMAGPFYDPAKLVPITNSALPEYYHGKWFIYEWARSWIKVVTLDSARREIVQIEDFLPSVKISKPIDFKVGPDGAIYLLEYGNDYFLNNPDARLVRISYSARNRPPVAALEASETAGGIPFQPTLSAAGSTDPDPKDSLQFRWFLNGEQIGIESEIQPVLTKPGIHALRLEVQDAAGSTSEATLSLAAGNSRPSLHLEIAGNRSFLLPGRNQLQYTASVIDVEDQAAGRLRPEEVLVNATWVNDKTLTDGLRNGTRQLPSGDLAFAAGASLLAESDCYTCHKERSENVGPSYLAVAERYDDSPATIKQLATKVIKGGNGAWGERLMSGHPSLSPENAATMVGYILSLNNGGLPLAGRVQPGDNTNGSYVLAASYRDRGGQQTPPLVGQQAVVLRPTYLEAEDNHDGLYRAGVPGSGQRGAFRRVTFRPGGWLKLANIDLTGVDAIVAHLHADQDGELELRYGSPEGELLAKTSPRRTEEWNAVEGIILKLPDAAQQLPQVDLYLVWKGAGGVVADDMGHHRPGDVGWIDAIEIEGSGIAAR
ncbi:MAG: PQQ-dependent sugar dehydrogenase [Bacteroidota bacterium]